MNSENALRFVRLTADYSLKSFDCGDDDLNDFLLSDAKPFLAQLLTVTYLLENDTDTIAFYSLQNDRVSFQDFKDDKTSWNRFNRRIPNVKRLRSYPAVKLGRLAVNSGYQSGGYGTIILDTIKELFVRNNRTGCKFLTVDAYSQALRFYERNGFSYLTTQDEGQQTRLMYFDLGTLSS